MRKNFANGTVRTGQRSKILGEKLSPVPTEKDILEALEQFGRKYHEYCPSEHDEPGEGRRSSQASDDEAAMVEGMHSAPPGDHLEDLESTSMSSSYSGEWEKLFRRHNYMQSLRSFGMRGKLRSSRFRSVCWKLYLEVLPEKQQEWLRKTRFWRKRYTDLKQKLIINPRKSMEGVDLSLNNPLSQEVESPWNQFFHDNELRLTIKQDVIRTYPRIQFFHTDVIRTMMVDGLFIYAKLNPDVSYRQGMHELLAPMIFVLHCDQQAFLHACEIESVSDVVKEILDPAYIEHDAFAMFCQVMETVEPWYVSKEISPIVKSKGIFVGQPFARVQDLNPSNVIVTKLTRIQDYLLKKYDPDLHLHLEKMEIAPQIYGIRWVRLLFGREFPMQDLLVLWDALFADGISFDLVDYVFVAMLLYLRDALLSSDYPTCLTTLMKFPPVGDVHYFVEKALYLREPNEQPRPPNYTYQRPAMLNTNGADLPHRRKQNASIGASMLSGLTTLTRRLNQSRPRSLTIDSPKKISKSTSEPMNLLTDESPVDYHPQDKRGSTASLSKLEDTESPYYHPALRPTTSAQSLARLETASSIRSADSTTSLARSDQLATPEGTSSPSHKFGTLPGGAKGKKGGKGPKAGPQDNLQQGISYLLGKLNDLEAMCRLCGSKMDIHIDKLQSEMLRQELENEDELLLALAGLKQVRDVLKGILKPSNLFDDDEIKIKENYYQTEHQMASANDLTPGSQSSKESPGGHDRRSKEQFYPSSSIDTSSDSSSPEYSDNNAGRRPQPPSDPGRQVGSASRGAAREGRPDIELSDFQLESPSHRSLSRQSSAGSTGGGSSRRVVSERNSPSVARRKQSERNSQWTFGSRHHRMGAFSDSESADMFDSNQNSGWFKTRRRSEDSGMHY